MFRRCHCMQCGMNERHENENSAYRYKYIDQQCDTDALIDWSTASTCSCGTCLRSCTFHPANCVLMDLPFCLVSEHQVCADQSMIRGPFQRREHGVDVVSTCTRAEETSHSRSATRVCRCLCVRLLCMRGTPSKEPEPTRATCRF